MSEATAMKAPTTVGALTSMDVAQNSRTILEFHDGQFFSHSNAEPFGLKKVHMLIPIKLSGTVKYEWGEVSYECLVIPVLKPSERDERDFHYPSFADEEMTEQVRQIAERLAEKGMPLKELYSHKGMDYVLEFSFEFEAKD